MHLLFYVKFIFLTRVSFSGNMLISSYCTLQRILRNDPEKEQRGEAAQTVGALDYGIHKPCLYILLLFLRRLGRELPLNVPTSFRERQKRRGLLGEGGQREGSLLLLKEHAQHRPRPGPGQLHSYTGRLWPILQCTICPPRPQGIPRLEAH